MADAHGDARPIKLAMLACCSSATSFLRVKLRPPIGAEQANFVPMALHELDEVAQRGRDRGRSLVSEEDWVREAAPGVHKYGHIAMAEDGRAGDRLQVRVDDVAAGGGVGFDRRARLGHRHGPRGAELADLALRKPDVHGALGVRLGVLQKEPRRAPKVEGRDDPPGVHMSKSLVPRHERGCCSHRPGASLADQVVKVVVLPHAVLVAIHGHDAPLAIEVEGSTTPGEVLERQNRLGDSGEPVAPWDADLSHLVVDVARVEVQHSSCRGLTGRVVARRDRDAGAAGVLERNVGGQDGQVRTAVE